MNKYFEGYAPFKFGTNKKEKVSDRELYYYLRGIEAGKSVMYTELLSICKCDDINKILTGNKLYVASNRILKMLSDYEKDHPIIMEI